MIAFSMMLASCFVALAGGAFAPGTAQQVSRTGSFDLPCDADTAFPFFSPEGEREWVQGWDPRPVFPSKIEFARDTVFREGRGDEEATWTILDTDWQAHRAEYVRVAPHSHAAHIVVKVEALSGGRSKVVVSYSITAFGKSPEGLVAAFSEEAYAAKMRDWQQRISACLKGRKA